MEEINRNREKFCFYHTFSWSYGFFLSRVGRNRQRHSQMRSTMQKQGYRWLYQTYDTLIALILALMSNKSVNEVCAT
jgi:hypothetical protein